jgi:cell division transport system ATP-binding protein
VPILRRQIGTVFQDFKLLNDRTAAENIALSMEILNKSRAAIDATVTELLSIINLSDKANRFPSELSGGEAQRVVIARAMATEPAVIFADEPTGNLDTQTGWQIIELLQKINQSGTAVILATHNKEHVEQLKTRIISLGEGKILEDKPFKQSKEDDAHAKKHDEHDSKPDHKEHHKEHKES